MNKYYSIVFINDYDDEYVSRILDELRQIGDTSEKEKRLYEHLLQWDNGEYCEEQERPFYGTSDNVVHFNEYILSYNTRLGYAGLEIVEKG